MPTELFTNFLASDASLVSYWRMEGNSTDTKGNYNGTDTSMTYSSTEKMFGQGAVFNGSSGYITLASGMANFTGGITISFWAKPTAVANWARFIDFGAASGTGSANIVFCRESTTNTLLWECGDGTGYTILRVTDGIILNEWHFYTATISSGAVSCLYRDGVLLNSASSATLPQNISRATNYIGKSNWADSLYQGYMDDVAIFNRALTSMEVATLYNLTINNYLTIDSQGSRRTRFPGNIAGIECQNASGGIVTYDGNYVIHTFTSSGTFICPGSGTAEVLVVAGGGGGGGHDGGGGGAGGYVYNATNSVSATAYTVTIGNGGLGTQHTTAAGSTGGNSSFNSQTAYGGGGGGSRDGANGTNGGCGGGAGSSNQTGFGTGSQGYNGGQSYTGSPYNGGGGGGCGAVGGNAPSNPAGTGGAGRAYSITGSSVYYGGGGGGGSLDGNAGSGVHGGGNGGGYNIRGSNGTANTGGGGGGGGRKEQNADYGGTGGSGVVIIRYLVNSLQL